MARAQKYRIVLVEPEYELNLGAAARLMRNFGLSPLYLVRPAASVGFTAKMHAKHAVDVLEGAVVCSTLEEALGGCSQVVGTTGVMRRHRNALRHPLMLEEFRRQIAGQKAGGRAKARALAPQGPIAILFGREGIGLSAAEIARCDVLITVPTSKKYPVMNLSHAMAVVLYALTAQEKKVKWPGTRAKNPGAEERRFLVQTFESLTERYAHNMRQPDKAKLAFKRIMGRAAPDQVEMRSVLTVLRQALRELEGEKIYMPKRETKEKPK